MKNIWKQFKQSTFYVKWTNWEYYPMYLANIPTVFFWLYFAIRSRSLFFFSAVNPVIETGGVLGESKINILNRLPIDTIPNTIYIKKHKAELTSLLEQISEHNITFPLICKPDIGERGFLVEKISNPACLSEYLDKITVDFIIQDYIDYEQEISVLYHRMPSKSKGKITSICIKKNLSVVGDGYSTIENLMEKYPRARFQLDRFQKDFPYLITQIPKKGQEVELEPIGNHCRGTTFLNGNHLIDQQLTRVFDQIAVQMDGIYYGRFDMKCKNFELLKEGRDFKILEFNGIASEPAHIYDPTYSTFTAYRDIFSHWKIIYEISKVQRKLGVKAMSLQEAYTSIRTYFKYMQTAKI